MKYDAVMAALRSYVVEGGRPASIFLLPEGGMRKIYDCIVSNGLRAYLELGSGFGATSCVMGAAAAETGGKVVTIDLALHWPANASTLKAHVGIGDELEVVADPLGYNWWLADLIGKQTVGGLCQPLFDFCFLDGAHEWQPDALAVYLAAKLLKPGGWFVLDDLDFNLRSMPTWKESHGHLSARELDSYQLKMVWDLVICQHPDLAAFEVAENGRMGWARKRRVAEKKGLFARLGGLTRGPTRLKRHPYNPVV
jgi:predicted O-methyltransferase YrrM